ncbi:YbbR-like domain-containing protein [Alteribacillus sp. YIM 98480]|uniref:CdaR family protein n=1 Tax=Alteribacillus sp. YIM 98480 TaxID=2606599 RepID=UPI00131EC727|nr:CdaR family protein [Alteribacillus sp. YIM 98480]
MDKLFNNHWFVKFVSLLIAVMLYMMVNMNNISNQPGVLPDNNDDSSYTIKDVEVNAYYDEENYEVVELEETVDVELRGPQTSIMLFQLSRPAYEVYVDLEDRGAGVHNVRLEYRDFPADLDVSITPRFVSVELQQLETVSYPVEAEVMNKEETAEGYTLGGAKVTPSEVDVKASPSVHDQIASLKAFVDAEGADERVESESEVVAYDQNGNELDVPINPETVEVEVPITSPFQKVPINLSREGTLPDNLSIEALNMDPTETTIFGPLPDIKDISNVEAILDLSEIEGDGLIEVDLIYPEGVEHIQPETVEVEVEVGEREETAFEEIPIEVENIPEDYSFEITDPDQGVSDVTIYGSSAVLENINKEDITLIADWEDGEEEGNLQTLPVLSSGPSEVNIEPEVHEIEVEWSQAEDNEGTDTVEETEEAD